MTAFGSYRCVIFFIKVEEAKQLVGVPRKSFYEMPTTDVYIVKFIRSFDRIK